MSVLRLATGRRQAWSVRTARLHIRAFDLQLTVYAALLATMGLAIAFSNSTETAASALTPGTTFSRGLVWAGLAVVAYLLAAAFDYSWLKTFAIPLYLLNLGLLALTDLAGSGPGGAARWISLGGFQLQPSELAKILVVVALARFLAAREGQLGLASTVVGAVLLVLPPWLLVLREPDLGTSLVLLAVLAGMLFLAGASLRWLAILVGLGLAALPFAWTHVLHDYQRQRLLSFLDPAADPLGSGYQLLHSQAAIGSGGLLGKGLTNGADALGALPVGSSDFVFASLMEEIGFVGGVVLLVFFAALLWRVLRAAWGARDPFGRHVAGGLATIILFQLLVNAGMAMGIMPITGIPLPFVSSGGSSLVSLALGLGIVQSVNIRHVHPNW